MSERAKHTPGPWSNVHGSIMGGRAAFCWIAQMHSTCIAAETYQADARLIAAAPELLEAMRAVVAVADRKTVEFDMAHAAIAKATGNHA